MFLIGWFALILGPSLPLHNHITDYYVFIPAIGIAMLASSACSAAWQRGWAAAGVAAALALLYLVPSIHVVRAGMASYFQRADPVRPRPERCPRQTYSRVQNDSAEGADNALFRTAVYPGPFRIFGWHDVLLTPDSPRADSRGSAYESSGRLLSSAVRDCGRAAQRRSEVYAVEGRRLRNITPPPLACSIDLALPVLDEQLGEGWYLLENGFLWSAPHAVVYLPGPAAPNGKLHVHGCVTEQQMKTGPMHLALTVVGHAMPTKVIDPALEFDLDYDLRSDVVERQKAEIVLTADRAFQPPGEGRRLGLVFGQFTIR